ncbi:MAG TPA: hypothetical protein VLG15_07540 [Thermoanaerobaculia bacterium]|nr:hypothetical protein [Thermoanaerobaculia bacterium]
MRLPGVAIILSLTTVAAAQTRDLPRECSGWPEKPAWEWTLDERIRHRLDADCRQARRELAAQDRKERGYLRTSGDPADFVYGTDTPELFLPSELYATLISNVNAGESRFSEAMRSYYERRASSLDLPGAFWKLVEEAAGDYLSGLQEERRLAAVLNGAGTNERLAILAEIADIQKPQCAQRIDALERTRRAFPPGSFDRFLYVAVAPGIGSSAQLVTTGSLRWREEGCPEGGRP